MLQPRTGADVTDNDRDQARVSAMDFKEAFVDEMRTARGFMCCFFLYSATQVWLYVLLCGDGALICMSIAALTPVFPDQEKDWSQITFAALLGVFGICSDWIGLRGFQQCQPEYIGIHLVSRLSQAGFIIIDSIRKTINVGFMLDPAIHFPVAALFVMWWFKVVGEAYKVARKHKYGIAVRGLDVATKDPTVLGKFRPETALKSDDVSSIEQSNDIV